MAVVTVTLSTAARTLNMRGDRVAADGIYEVGPEFFADWYSVPDSKSPVRERPVQDGAFGIDRDYRSALPLSMMGWFRGSNWPAMLTALRAATAPGAAATVTVVDHMGTSWRNVSIRRMVPTPNPWGQRCTFELYMIAEDSRLYGPMQSASTGMPTLGTGQAWPQVWPVDWGTGGNPGRASALNSGSVLTPLKLTVSGGLGSGVELVNVTNGRTLRLERVIPQGSQVVFDANAGRAYLDQPSNDITGFMTRREWDGFLIPGGVTAVVQTNSLGTQTGTPTLTLAWASAS